MVFWVVVIVGGSIAGAIFNAARSDEGDITRAGDLHVSELRVGDCFNIKDAEATVIDDVTALPCEQAHEFELFLVKAMPAGSYPTDDAFFTFVEDECVPAFDGYVGRAYEDSALEIYWLTPTREAWGDGDLSVQCVVFHPLIDELTESQRGADR